MIGTDEFQHLESPESVFSHQAGSEPLPGYRLLEPLGQGGFGEVWKCEAPGGFFKAMKFIGGEAHALADHNAAAAGELKAVRRLRHVRHPFLLSMERVEIINGELVIVMELADRSLADVLTEAREEGQPGIPREQVLAYLGEAAEVLDLMRVQHGLQHLDVKPQNLFVVSNHIKVGDFGLVQSCTAGQAGVEVSGLSPLYSSPELFEGRISERSDQYSLAIVYQELLSGRLPYSGKNPRQLLMQHLQGNPNLEGVPPEDRHAVVRALCKDPARRFSSCSDFVRALSSGQADLILLSEPARHVAVEPPLDETVSDLKSIQRSIADTDPEMPLPVAPPLKTAPRLRSCLRRGPLDEIWDAIRPDGGPCVAHILLGVGRPAPEALEKLSSLSHAGLQPFRIAPPTSDRLVVVTDPSPPSLRDRWLEARKQGQPGLPREELLSHIRSVARTLDELEKRHGLQHLALHPGSLLVYNRRVVVAEFGLAQLLYAPAGISATALNARYSAPELFQKQPGPGCDQYSLALIYSELLTGVLPTKVTERARSTSSSGLPFLDRLPERDPQAVSRALDLDAGRRWPSLSDFVEALEPFPESEEPAKEKPTATLTHAALQLPDLPIRSPRLAATEEPAFSGPGPRPAPPEGRAPTPPIPSHAVSVPPVPLQARLGVDLTREVIRHRLDAFLQQWTGSVVREEADELTLHMTPPPSVWQRCSGQQPQLEVQLTFADAALVDTARTEVTLAIQALEGDSEATRVVAPLLLDSFHAYLRENSRSRGQERIPWLHPLWLWPILEDGLLGPPQDCQGKDISLNGIGFYLPGELISKDLCLYLPATPTTGEVTVSAKVVRAQACGDGWFQIGALLLAPWGGPCPRTGQRLPVDLSEPEA